MLRLSGGLNSPTPTDFYPIWTEAIRSRAPRPQSQPLRRRITEQEGTARLSDQVKHSDVVKRERGAGVRRRKQSGGTVTRFRQDLMHFVGAANVYIILGLPPAGHPSTFVLAHYLPSQCWYFFELLASQASCNDSIGKEILLRRPPPSFGRDFEGDVRSRSHDTDED